MGGTYGTHGEMRKVYNSLVRKREGKRSLWTVGFEVLSHGGEYEDGCLLGCSAV
jgi:hypothetical protein